MEKERANKKIQAKFGIYNSQASCPEEALGEASFAEKKRLLAELPLPTRGSWNLSAPGRRFLAEKPCQEAASQRQKV